MIEAISRALRQPEYIHVLLNPLPVYGLAIATLALALALVRQNRTAQKIALLLIFFMAASAWPVAHFGSAAYDNVLALADNDGQAWLETHAKIAGKILPIFYSLAALALAAILLPKKWPNAATGLAIATLLLAICSLGAGGYVGYLGGKIRHREFRIGAPPP